MGVNEHVQYVRENFEKKYAKNIANGIYDTRDLNRLRSDSTFVSSYIPNQDKLDEAVDLVHSSLKFRNEFKVNDLTESSFDRELLQIGSAYFHNKDINGNRILWLRVKVHRKDASAERLAAEKLGLIFVIEKAFSESPLDGIVVLLDMTACGLVNLDVDFVKYIITVFKMYYPTFLASMLIYDMPWIFNAAWRVVKQWLSPESVAKIKFVSKADVQTYIKAEDLPPHMGGTDDFQYVYTPGMTNDPLYPEDEAKTDKKVQFQEAEEFSPNVANNDTPFSSDTEQSKNDVNANAVDGLRRRTHSHNLRRKLRNLNNSALDKKHLLMQSRSLSRTFVGRYLQVSPGDELTFVAQETADSFDIITLTNTLPYPVAFKVKTTSPEKFRVRPSTGIIQPDKKEEVYVYLVPDETGDVSKDKFLIMAMEAQGEVVDPNQLFRDASKDKIMQHKLKCCLTTQESLQAKNKMAQSGAKAAADPLMSRLEQLDLQNRHVQRKLNMLLVMQFLTILTLFLVIASYSCFGEDLFSYFLALPFDFCHETCGRKC